MSLHQVSYFNLCCERW